MASVRARALDDPPDDRPGRLRLLGVPLDPIRLPALMSAVLAAVKQRDPITIFYVNVHSMNVAQQDTNYRHLLEDADIVYCDGTGVRLAAALMHLEVPERMTGADWIHDLCRLAVRHDLSLFLMGSAGDTASEAARVLAKRYPGLRVAGSAPGYSVGQDTIAAIRQAHPDILLVGTGTPRQERWIMEHRAEVGVPVVWAVGALFEFVSGRIRRGPHWMTDHGLEWLCRLVVEPRKLWRRYLLGNPRFFWRVALHIALRRDATQ
jgi:N-acetylglucosaminyldiphosphoundecaprenol N-acetyl-beta-D-mannosaminyltransferase